MHDDLFDRIPRIEGEGIVIRRLGDADVPALNELVRSPNVYRYLPTYLFEKQFADQHQMIRQLYGTCFAAGESLILGVETCGDKSICGLAELYGLRRAVQKVSLGYRFLEWGWGRGVATKVVGIMVDYLRSQTSVRLVTASTMVQNEASARVLHKNGFVRIARAVPEDWGYNEPTIADKWSLSLADSLH